MDLKIAINQTPDEEEGGVMRLGVIAHRHRKRSTKREAMVLQQLTIGLPMIDSEWYWKGKGKKKKGKK